MDLTYLDHAATSPMRPGAVAAMLPYLSEQFANPEGAHRFARQARQAVDEARDAVAAVLGVAPGEIVFTSGGTESDNTAVAGGGAGPVGGSVGGSVVVTSAAEHHAVLEPAERVGARVVPVTPTGHVDLGALAGALDGDVRLVSVMAVNNEVGTVTDIAAVAACVRERAPQAALHTDAVQAASWLALDGVARHVDLLSLSGHKFGGPKGVGVLVVKRGVALQPLLLGGGQERERRSGTHNVAGIVALATALRHTAADLLAETARIEVIRQRVLAALTSIEGVTATVAPHLTVPGIVHVCIDGIESEALLYLLDQAGVCAAAASACASGAMERSHVLAAMGVPAARAAGALRLSFGHTTTAADAERAVDVLSDAIARLRSPQHRWRTA